MEARSCFLSLVSFHISSTGGCLELTLQDRKSIIHVPILKRLSSSSMSLLHHCFIDSMITLFNAYFLVFGPLLCNGFCLMSKLFLILCISSLLGYRRALPVYRFLKKYSTSFLKIWIASCNQGLWLHKVVQQNLALQQTTPCSFIPL